MTAKKRTPKKAAKKSARKKSSVKTPKKKVTLSKKVSSKKAAARKTKKKKVRGPSILNRPFKRANVEGIRPLEETGCCFITIGGNTTRTPNMTRNECRDYARDIGNGATYNWEPGSCPSR